MGKFDKTSRKNELTAVMNRNLFDSVPGDVTDPVDIQRWNDFREKYHSAHKLEYDGDFPLQIDFELTSQCNFRCSFCTHGYMKVPKKRMSFEDFKRVIDEGAEYGLCSIKLNMINEPLLTPDIEKYIEYAKSKGVLNIYFATNGSLLTPKVQEKLIDAKLSKCMISLDATTSETFEKMRHSKQFDRIIENIHSLIKMRESKGVTYPLIRVNFVKTKLNIHEADKFIEYWSEIADMVGFQDQVGVPGVDKEDQPDANISLTVLGNPEEESPCSTNVSTLGRDEGSIFNLPDEDKGRKGFRCSFPFKMIVVDSSGNLLPCCTFSGKEMPIGNIDSMTVKEAWDSAKVRKLKELHKCGSYADDPVCKHCVESSGCDL